MLVYSEKIHTPLLHEKIKRMRMFFVILYPFTRFRFLTAYLVSHMYVRTRVSAFLALGVAKTSHAEIRLSRPLFMLLYIRSKLVRRALNFHDIYMRAIVRCVQSLCRARACFLRSLACEGNPEMSLCQSSLI